MHAQPRNRLLVALEAVRSRLAHTYILVVLGMGNRHRLVEAAEITIELGQAVVVLGLEPPDDESLKALQASHRLGLCR